jgi:radical SAM protein with 4Fe4S-binding SPASM domain
MLLNELILKPIVTNNYPITLTVCSGNICNLRCNLCPTGKKKSGRKTGFLGIEVVKSIIKELGDYLYSIDLFDWGEPLLNKNIFEIIHLFKKARISTVLSTNLNIFEQKFCNEIVESGLDTLIVSLDGYSQEALNYYQVGSNFEKVVSNVKKLAEYKNKKKLNHPKIVWRFLVNRFNEKDLLKAYKNYKEIGFDSFEPGPMYCDMDKILTWDTESQFVNLEPYFPKNEYWSFYDYNTKEKKHIYKKCSLLWSTATINWNGSISPCCAVWDENYDFGNILQNGFEKIWNGKKYQIARRIIKSKNINLNSDIICSICKKNNNILY